MKGGWYQILFLHELENAVTVVNAFDKAMIAVKRSESIELYDAVCPHRGAHLGYGGELCGSEIICPFHGCKIGLDEKSSEGYLLNRYPLLKIDSLLFTKNTDNSKDDSLTEYITDLRESHVIIPGFTIKISAPAIMVIENAFDQMHFRTVHKILNEPQFEIISSGNENLYHITSHFDLPISQWQTGEQGEGKKASSVSIPYEAIAFSPFTVISNLGGSRPYHIITSSKQINVQETEIRLSIAIKNELFNDSDINLYKYLIEQSGKGLEKDALIWSHMSPDATSRFQSHEKAVIGFQKFCKTF